MIQKVMRQHQEDAAKKEAEKKQRERQEKKEVEKEERIAFLEKQEMMEKMQELVSRLPRLSEERKRLHSSMTSETSEAKTNRCRNDRHAA